MKSNAETVDAYVAGQPAQQRVALEPVLGLVRQCLPEGYEEVMSWGMPTWQVPLDVYPDTYNRQPFLFAGLAARKGHLSRYLSGPLGDPAIERDLLAGFAGAGKNLDMGASCIRFKTVDQLHLPAIEAAIKAMPLERLVARARAARARK